MRPKEHARHACSRIVFIHFVDDLPDLELLALFLLLYRERHLTRAALRAGKSQPAMSRALERMRGVFGDALFVRSPAGMVPTPRAEALVPEVERLLEAARAVVRRDDFDPRALVRAFVIGTSDLVEAHLLAALYAAAAREAPGVDLQTRTLTSGDPGAEIAAGRLDVLIGPEASLPAGSVRQHLFDDAFVCAVRADHPRVRRKLSLETFLALAHVQIAPRGDPGGAVDAALSARGLARRVAVRTPSFLAAPLVVARSDLVLTAPSLVLGSLAAPLGLRLFPPPLEVPGFRMFQGWHPRAHGDAAHRWFRALVASVARPLVPARER
jgi:DNA-binding transcriptional LysR family regulator